MSQREDMDLLTKVALCDEVRRARKKFPSNRHLLAALMEEVGEVAEALLHNHHPHHIHEEALQVACVAVRIKEEGDADFPSALSPAFRELAVMMTRLGAHANHLLDSETGVEVQP